jgi:predicted PurR-regulated permease PerM
VNAARAYRILFWLGLGAAAFVLLGLVQGIILPFAAGFVIAYTLAPAVARLERWGIRRTLGSLFVLIVFLFAVAFVLVLLVPLIQVQVVQLINKMPALVDIFKVQLGRLTDLLKEQLPADWVAKVQDSLSSKLGEAVTWLASVFQGMVTSSFAILNILSLVIVTPIVIFFLLRDWDAMIAVIDSYLPRDSLETVRGQARVASDTLVGFIHGQALICLILAIYYGVALTAAQLKSAAAVGVLIGVLAIIPVLGATAGFVLSLGLAATQYGTWTEIFIVIGIFAFGQFVEGNVLTPKLVGDRIHLHPLWVIFALFAAAALFGFVGVLLAVPAAAVIGVLIRFALARYRRSAIYDPRQPENVRGLTPFR